SHGPALALGLLMLTAVGAALSAVEQGGILAMTQFSSAYLEAEAAARGSFEHLRAAGSLLRNGMHYVGLIMHGMTLACLYILLWRSAALPRALSALGLGAACLQMYAIACEERGREHEHGHRAGDKLKKHQPTNPAPGGTLIKRHAIETLRK
ncbi:MAG: DUF4386 family protein, partial [Pseudomonadota bacterium]